MNHFNELLKAARLQDQPQRLLLLFARATPMKGPVKTDHCSGTIEPVMCVDKAPGELEGFESLVKEADTINSQWDFILIGSLSGSDGKPPRAEEVEAQLYKMSNKLPNHGDLSAYVVLDRQQRPVIIS